MYEKSKVRRCLNIAGVVIMLMSILVGYSAFAVSFSDDFHNDPWVEDLDGTATTMGVFQGIAWGVLGFIGGLKLFRCKEENLPDDLPAFKKVAFLESRRWLGYFIIALGIEYAIGGLAFPFTHGLIGIPVLFVLVAMGSGIVWVGAWLSFTTDKLYALVNQITGRVRVKAG